MSQFLKTKEIKCKNSFIEFVKKRMCFSYSTYPCYT